MKLSADFYLERNVLRVARNLLGKYLFTCIDGLVTGGYIVEVEAYNGVVDRASHAFGHRHTSRTKTMYQMGGVAYVYLCYGMHELCNVVTSQAGVPHAVLLRGLQPVVGLPYMMVRRGMNTMKPSITSGPGSLSKALGISRQMDGLDLRGDDIWIEDRGLTFADEQIATGPRIGVHYAGKDALLPYRFYVRDNPYVSG